MLQVTGSSSKIRFEPLPADDPKQRCPDIARAKALLAWEPKISLKTGLKLSLPYFRECLAATNLPVTLPHCTAGKSAREPVFG